MAIAEFLSDIIIFLYAFFACAVVASRRRARRWSSPPAPRRARAPAASTPHAHDAASFRNLAAPARTDDRRTNDATSGPQEWLTGTLHDGGIRSVRSPLRRAPLLATPIATPLQCGRPKRPGLLFNFSLPTVTAKAAEASPQRSHRRDRGSGGAAAATAAAIKTAASTPTRATTKQPPGHVGCPPTPEEMDGLER